MRKYKRVARIQDGVEVVSVVDLLLVKRDLPHYMQNVMVVKGMGRSPSDQHVVLGKFRLVGARIKRREVVDGARRIRSEKLWEHQ